MSSSDVARVYGYFTSPESTRKAALNHNIELPKGKLISATRAMVSYIDHYFATHGLLHLKMMVVVYPPNSDTDGFLFRTRVQPEDIFDPASRNPNRPDFAETEKDKEMREWLVQGGLDESEFQWITVLDDARYIKEPEVLKSKYIEFDTPEEANRFLDSSMEEKVRLYEAWIKQQD